VDGAHIAFLRCMRLSCLTGLLPGNGKTAAGHPFVYQRGNRLPFD
jgi:hypothetical protein